MGSGAFCSVTQPASAAGSNAIMSHFAIAFPLKDRLRRTFSKHKIGNANYKAHFGPSPLT
jgi:hypothetical protein